MAATLRQAIETWLKDKNGPGFNDEILEAARVCVKSPTKVQENTLVSNLEQLALIVVSPDANDKLVNYLHSTHRPSQCTLAALAGLKLTSYAALERAAYYKFEHGLSVGPLRVDNPDILRQILQVLKTEIRHVNEGVTAAGRAAMSIRQTPNDSAFDAAQDKPVKTWLLQYMVTDTPVDTDWSFVVPACLNLVDDPRAEVRSKGCLAVAALVARYRDKVSSAGLMPLFWDSITPSLEMLPPSVPVEKSQVIVGAAVEALLTIAGDEAAKLNYVLRHGPLTALSHTEQNIKFATFLLGVLDTVVQRCGSLVIGSLGHVVTVFKAVTCDPFSDMAPELLQAACNMMATVVRFAWPRIPYHKYDILLGIAKTGTFDTPCCQLLVAACGPDFENDVAQLRDTAASGTAATDPAATA